MSRKTMDTEREPREGDVLTGPSKTLNDAHFLFLSGLTGDVHPIHYDAEYAKETRFGKPLAHGLLLAALGATPASERFGKLAFMEQACRFLRFASRLTNQHRETLLEDETSAAGTEGKLEG